MPITPLTDLMGDHQAGISQMDAARMGCREEAEEVRLFAHMPAAVSRTETVRMPPALWVDGMLQGDFHAVYTYIY